MSLRERLSASEEERPLAVVVPEAASRAYQELKVLERIHHGTSMLAVLHSCTRLIVIKDKVTPFGYHKSFEGRTT